MVRRRTIGKKRSRRIARERMDILLNLAGEVFHSDRELSRRYVSLARRIGMRYNVRLTKKDKLMVCKRCNSFLVPGVNCRVRTHALRAVITCLECGSVRRIPFVKERKGKLNKHQEKNPVKR
ncbi:MAG: ribonuclease P protein component 4 [Candidatus Hydrothermarchaeales archaeon]